ADGGEHLVAHEPGLRGDAVDRQVVGRERQAVRAGRVRKIPCGDAGDVRAVAEVVLDCARGQVQVVDHFLVGVRGRDRGADAEARRGRVAAEHRVRPVNARVYDGDVDALPFDAARLERVAHVNLRRVAVELRRAHVVNGVVEEHGDGRVRVHGLHPAHLLDDGDGRRRDGERDAVVDVVEAELDGRDLAVRPV